MSPARWRRIATAYSLSIAFGATAFGAERPADASGTGADTIAQAAPGSRESLFGDDLPKKPADQPAKPSSRESLFGDDLPKKPADKPAKPPSRESLFGDDIPPATKPGAEPTKPQTAAKERPDEPGVGWRGYVQSDLAYTYADPDHWSKARVRFEIGRQGRLSQNVKYKVTGRFDYDAVFDIEPNFYPPEVRDEQRRGFQVRETYLDVSAGNWEFRLGRQHIIWGEVPGLFFADVVSAKDLREFVLQEFDSLRIPQWAARAEYFAGDVHLEAIWIPYVTVDRIGKPGTEFFPFPPPPPAGFDSIFLGEQKPSRQLSNSNFGFRASTLRSGWDLSAFIYRSIDAQATFYRDIVAGPVPTFVFRPQHDRITQTGGTVAKDLGDMVLKAEVIYNHSKGFSVQRLSDVDGVAKLNFVDYLIGVDVPLPADTRLNAYFFQRHFTKHDPDVVPERDEFGLTFLLSKKITSALELQALFITSLNRSDWVFRPRATWNFAKNWRMNVGADILHGPQLGFFGQYADKDRVYADVRYSF
jgi:hypothetical protein